MLHHHVRQVVFCVLLLLTNLPMFPSIAYGDQVAIGPMTLTGLPLSVSAAIGFIALFGQAVLNGVVMVSYFNHLRSVVIRLLKP